MTFDRFIQFFALGAAAVLLGMLMIFVSRVSSWFRRLSLFGYMGVLISAGALVGKRAIESASVLWYGAPILIVSCLLSAYGFIGMLKKGGEV